jgi:O-antigen/teichoic acid export membrane protein
LNANPINIRLQRASINLISGGVGYVLPMLVNLIATPFLLRGLGEIAYGLQSLVGVIIGYLLVMEMGLDLPIVKLLAEDRAKNDIESENRMLSTTLQLYCLIGLIGMIVIVLLSDWLAQNVFKVTEELRTQAILVFRLAGIGFFGSIGMSWGRALTAGLQRYEITQGVSAVFNVAGVGMGLIMVYTGYGVVGFVFIRVVAMLAMGPAYWLLARRFMPMFRVHWGLDRASLRRISGYAGYGLFNRVVSGLIGRLDKMLIGIWLGVALVGVYAVPFMVMSSVGNLIANTLGFIFPLASEFHGLEEMNRLRDIFIRSTRFATAMAGMIFVPLFVLSDIFLTLWVPSIAEQASGVLRLLALAGFLGISCASMTNLVIIGIGRIGTFTIYTTIRNIVLGVCLFLMIRPFGLKGAGWALLLTVIVDVVYLIIASRNYLQLSPWVLFRSAHLKQVILCTTLGLLVWLARPLAHSWLGLTGVVIVLELLYVTVGYVIGVFGETEKRAVLGLWNMVFRSHKHQAVEGRD